VLLQLPVSRVEQTLCCGARRRLLLYPDDNHGIYSIASDADLSVNMSRWFKKHV
jgi:hypothetical protein